MNSIFELSLVLLMLSVFTRGEQCPPKLHLPGEKASMTWKLPPGKFMPLSIGRKNADGSVTMLFYGSTESGETNSYPDYRDRLSIVDSLNAPVPQVEFTLKDVTAEDAGHYVCVNSFGDAPIIPDCGQTLVILGKPENSTIVPSSAPVENKPLTLDCSISSTSLPPDHNLPLTVEWTGSVKTLTDAESRVQKNGTKLVIVSVQRSDDGSKFQCRGTEDVTRDLWSGLSAEYELILESNETRPNKSDCNRDVESWECDTCKPESKKEVGANKLSMTISPTIVNLSVSQNFDITCIADIESNNLYNRDRFMIIIKITDNITELIASAQHNKYPCIRNNDVRAEIKAGSSARRISLSFKGATKIDAGEYTCCAKIFSTLGKDTYLKNVEKLHVKGAMTTTTTANSEATDEQGKETNDSKEDDEEEDGGLNTGMAVGAAVLLLLMSAVIYSMFKRKTPPKEKEMPAAIQSMPDNAQSKSDTVVSKPDTAVFKPDTAESKLDTAESKPDTAESNLDTAESKPDTAESDPSESESELRATSSNVDTEETSEAVAMAQDQPSAAAIEG